jgi:hypothetical protein
MIKQKTTIEPCELLKLAYTLVLISMLYFFAITFIPIPDSGQDNAKYISGFLIGTGLSAIVQYYFRRVGSPDGAPTDPKEEEK